MPGAAPRRRRRSRVPASHARQRGPRRRAGAAGAALHGFPGTFAFPASVTLRQRYSLLGNSLHVHVVALLLEHLLTGVRLPEDGRSRT